jgi:membrane protease YdiL (CAAX protease family)
MLAAKPWKLEAVGLLFLGVFIALCLGAMLAGLAGHFTSAWPKAQNDFWQIFISAVFLEVPTLVLISLFLRRHDMGWTEAFGLNTTPPATAAAYGILLGTLFVPATWVLENLSEFALKLIHVNPEMQMAVQELQDPSLTFAEKAVLGVIVVVLAPLVEEALFRGILYPALKQQGRPRLALWGSSALFAAMHLNMASFLPLLIFALALVYLYETFQNLLAPIVAHSLFNAANFLMVVFSEQIGRALHLK